MNPTGYAQAVEEFEVVAGTPGSWVRTRSTVVGLDVLSTSTPRFAFGGAPGHDPDPQPDAPLVMVYDAGGSVRDLLANHVAPGDIFTFAGDAGGRQPPARASNDQYALSSYSDTTLSP